MLLIAGMDKTGYFPCDYKGELKKGVWWWLIAWLFMDESVNEILREEERRRNKENERERCLHSPLEMPIDTTAFNLPLRHCFPLQVLFARVILKGLILAEDFGYFRYAWGLML
ncbi:hypothetical protein QYF36_019212 [Acer negundo]|nr:hypothetical protein QYF36_019212 [Acer negundo]